MIIRKIKMVGFRGFHNVEIDFESKPVVLLAAPNGMGKTTVIDAIEWCLTGEIGRLKSAIDSRRSNEAERGFDNDGILKNRDASADDTVKVFLWLNNDGIETVLCREQKKDELNPNASKVSINGDYVTAERFLRQYHIDGSFYNYHFCDVQKSVNIQSTKEKDLESFFSDFITDYDDQKQIAENMLVFAEDVDRCIKENEEKKVSENVIKNSENRIKEIKDTIHQIPYPMTSFYPGERLSIINLNKEELAEQRANVEKCGFYAAGKDISKLIENETLKELEYYLRDIVYFWKTKSEFIRRAINIGLSNRTEVLTKLETRYDKLKKLSFSKDTFFNDLDVALAFDVSSLLVLNDNKAVIQEKEKTVEKINADIDLLSGNNKLLTFMSNLSANKSSIINYRNISLQNNKIARCPICGSESFAYIKEDRLLKEVDDYIKRNGDVVKKKEIEKSRLQSEIDTLYLKMISNTREIVQKELDTLELKINELKMIEGEILPYFEAVKYLEKIGVVFDASEITEEKASELLVGVKNNILPESKENELAEEYQNILEILGFDFDRENLQQTYTKLSNYQSQRVPNFSYEVFVEKIQAIDRIRSNQTVAVMEKKLEEDIEKNIKLDDEINNLIKLKNTALQRADNIRKIIDRLSYDEYEKIGPTLGKYYNKLIRFDSNNGIHIIHKNDGISLVDNKSKNILNILSNGQISVFMLAYFFAGINARNEQEKIKIYFIDDLTACMDKVNMLAFIDLLKYELSLNRAIDQLFFVTCDDRIQKLLMYKLQGRGIEVKELVEKDFAHFHTL